MRLHQPYRFMQPPQRLHHPRSHRPRILDPPFPDQWLLDRSHPEPAPRRLQRQEVCPSPGRAPADTAADSVSRIVDNAHLLDATEIFRTLNRHKKVRLKNPTWPSDSVVVVWWRGSGSLTLHVIIGIVHQARLPPHHVLLLPLQHDRCADPGRVLSASRTPGLRVTYDYPSVECILSRRSILPDLVRRL